MGDRLLRAVDVLHIRSPLDRAALWLAREAIATAIALDRHAAKLFGRGARPGAVVSLPSNMSEMGLKKIEAHWGPNAAERSGQTLILTDGATFEQLAFSSVDAQFLENRKFQIIEIARAFRIPPSMLYELDRATWSNTEQMGREFLSYTLETWIRVLECALHRALFLPDERRHFAVRIDRDDLTRADLATRATAINSLIASRVLNPNEARGWIGLPRRRRVMDRIEVKASLAVDDAGVIEGVAWPFGVGPDITGDEISRGAFNVATIPLPMLDSHDPARSPPCPARRPDP